MDRTFTIRDLKNINNLKFDNIPKSFGVELVDLGFLNYKKLTPENYYYWWYEVEDIEKANKKNCTYNWTDLIPTRKMELAKSFIQYHNDNESAYRLFDAILNIESAKYDGMPELTRVVDFYYGKRKQKDLQMDLFNNCA